MVCPAKEPTLRPVLDGEALKGVHTLAVADVDEDVAIHATLLVDQAGILGEVVHDRVNALGKLRSFRNLASESERRGIE